MLLATKCPHCKTTFRVANDQLKLQAGLVRCGVCQQVFNGIEHLAGANPILTSPASSSISAPVTPAAPISQPANTTPVEAPISEKAAQATIQIKQTESVIPQMPLAESKQMSTDELEFDLPGIVSAPASAPTFAPKPIPTTSDFLERVEPQLETELASEPTSPAAPYSFGNPVGDSIIGTRTKAELEAEVQALLDADLQAELLVKGKGSSNLSGFEALEPALYSATTPTFKQEETIVVAPAFSEFDETHNSPRIAGDALLDTTQHDVLLSQSEHTSDNNALENIDQLNFIRQAKNKQRSFWLLTISTLFMLLLLIGQATYLLRDLIAAMYPSSKDTLVTLCSYAKCQIKLPAQIDALSYEADELHSLPHENTFELGMLLHNRSNLPQQWPNIELTLKSTQKQAILRRVFTPADYLSNPRDSQTGFQPNQEQSVKMYFEVAQLKASDFVVAIFYP